MSTVKDTEIYLNGLDPSSLLSIYFAINTPKPSISQLRGYVEGKGVLVIPEQLKGYTLNSVIGAGAFGHCYLSEHVATNGKMVVKVGAKGLKYGVGYEGAILSYLQSHSVPNIIRLFETFSFGDTDVMVMEHADKGDLTTFYEEEDLGVVERIANAKNVVKDIAGALSAMHGLGVVHRDIRPGNIVLLQNQVDGINAKLIDFGTAVDITRENYPTDCVPSSFSAPELENSDQVDLMACDVYALGAIWYSLIEMELYDPEKGFDDVVDEHQVVMDGMIQKMLKKNPLERPMMYQVHEYLCNQSHSL